MKAYEGLKLAQVERKINAFKDLKETSRTSRGWVKLIRKALGMSLETLANKLDIDTSTLARLEDREAKKKVTLEKLEEAARALDCELVYALVPKTTLQEQIDRQATSKAKKLLSKADLHMDLEAQKVQSSYEERVELLKQQLIKKGDIW